MCPLELSLANKVMEGVIATEEAMAAANRPNILEEYLKTKGGIASQSTVGTGGGDQGAVNPERTATSSEKKTPEKKSSFMSWGKK